MKNQLSLLVLGTLLAVAGPLGCKPSDSVGGGSAATMSTLDLSKVESAFAWASGTIKAEWDKIATAIKSQDYSGAWASLQNLASNASLSADQKSALSDLMVQIKAKTGDALKSATEAASKAIEQAKEAATKAAGNAPPK